MSKFFLVGGAVRDLVLGLEPNDFDYVCQVPDFEALIEACKDAGFLPVPNANTGSGFVEFPETLGLKCMCPVLKQVVDIHCARKEFNYKDGAHPENVVVGSLFEDVDRRDFTCNQLLLERGCYDLDRIIDIHHGLQHIEEKTLWCVGDPLERLSENPDRVIRAFRFASKYGWDLSEPLHDAILTESLEELVRRENDDRKLKSLNKILKDKSCYLKLFDFLSNWYPEMANAIFSNIGLIASNQGQFKV
jgi:tRNA nucleotidyltransferase (CCA-adding enzyme)